MSDAALERKVIDLVRSHSNGVHGLTVIDTMRKRGAYRHDVARVIAHAVCRNRLTLDGDHILHGHAPRM